MDQKTCSFSQMELPTPIIEAVDKLGFEQATPIQTAGLPILLAGSDAILQAQTGSGKTLCFCLPLLKNVDDSSAEVQAIIISPTRELAEQTDEVIASLKSNLKTALIIGGVNQDKQEKAIKAGAQIIIGTPGRILDLIKQKIVRLGKCKYFVLDEADEMLSMGFLKDVRQILSRLPDKRQGVFISATMTPRVDMLANAFLTSPDQVSLSDSGESTDLIEHFYINVASDVFAKPKLLVDILEANNPSSAIVFCNTKSDTQMLEVYLKKHGFNARRINSDLSQKQRSRVMKMIRDGEVDILIATDIAARGIDLEELELVVNYTVHDDAENYVHRSGRTGRAGKQGKAITFVSVRDFGAFHQLQKQTSIEFKEMEAPSADEIANAHLLKLYKRIRVSAKELTELEIATAKALLEDQDQDITETVARLIKTALSVEASSETKSLDEEILDDDEEDLKEEQRPRSRERRESRDRRNGREDRRGGRDERPRDSGDEQGERRDRTPKGTARVYISQGTVDGLNEDLLISLCESLGDVQSDKLKDIRVRQAYSFVSTHPKVADILIENLNGIDYNERTLSVELASIIEKPRQHGGRGRHSGGGRHRSGGNRRRSN